MRSFIRAAGWCVLLAAAGCPKNDEPPAVTRGRQTYNSQCTACHNANPSQPGAVGPEVKGATRDLIEAKLVHGKYPTGYAPKRSTALMPQQPQLAGSIDDLAAFLTAP